MQNAVVLSLRNKPVVEDRRKTKNAANLPTSKPPIGGGKLKKENCALAGFIRRKSASTGREEEKELATNYAQPNLHVFPPRATNDYVHLDVSRSSNNLRMDDPALKTVKQIGSKQSDSAEDGYVDIDQHPIVVDMLRLKNRELLQNRASSVFARRHSEQFNCSSQTESIRHQSALSSNNFGSSKEIQNASKFGNNNASMNCRSTLDLPLHMNFYECRNRGKTKTNAQCQQSPAPFPTLLNTATLNSPVKSCKKIIAQNRRAISPNSAISALQFPRNGQKLSFNRANSYQSLLNSGERVPMHSAVQSNRSMNNRINHVRSSSFAQRFPALRIEPAPSLPRRQSRDEMPFGKGIADGEYAWEKAEQNLQKLINTLEEDAKYMELPIHPIVDDEQNHYHEIKFKKSARVDPDENNSTNKNGERENLDNDYAEMGQSKNLPDPSSFNTFLSKFLASSIRELAVRMSEADCRTFGWPPNTLNGCHANFWSLNENGQKIRTEIRQRSELIKRFVSNSLQKDTNCLEIFEKWMQLANELYASFGNFYAFMNIIESLIEKMNCLSAQPITNEFRTKLLPLYNSLKGNDFMNCDDAPKLLLPYVQTYFDELPIDGQLSGQFVDDCLQLNVKLDLLWTFTQLARQMFDNDFAQQIVKRDVPNENNLFSNDNIQNLLSFAQK